MCVSLNHATARLNISFSVNQVYTCIEYYATKYVCKDFGKAFS